MLRNLGTLVLLLLLATPLAAVAQNTGRIAGTVTDDLGDPLPGANVVIEGTQLGAATDIDGNYFIIGVPVGTYTLTASFVGYASQTVEGLEVSSGYTTEQNFELGPQELGTIEVTYERPIIQRDAVGVPKVVTGEQLENLPIRGVAAVAATQGGVVASATGDLNIRGGRGEEVAYYVDGVKVSAARLGVNQQAIQEQEILVGTIPARYGDVQSGVISITTKSGSPDFFGSAELITSEVLDAYGYNLGSLSLGGPIVPNRASFFASVQGTSAADANPYGGGRLYELSDELYQDMLQSPQALRYIGPEGDVAYVNFPVEIARQAFANGTALTPDSLAQLIELPAELDGYELDGAAGLINRPDTITEDDVELVTSKRDPLRELTFNGNVSFDISRALSLRIGGNFETYDREVYSFDRGLYNRDKFYNNEQNSWRAYGTFRQRLSDNAFYQIQAEYEDWKLDYYPNGFSSNVEDAFRYGDISDPNNATAANYFVYRGGVYEPRFTEDATAAPGAANQFAFALPGNPIATFQKQHDQSLRFSGNATTQLGVHQLEFGGEFQQETRRYYSLAGFALARYAADDDCESPSGVCYENYSELPFNAFRPRATYYGYDYRGLNEVDDQDIDAYYNVIDAGTGERENTNVAPYKPVYYAGYIQDKIEYRDLVINVGFRLDVFDNNTQVLKDIYAPLPIVRAGEIGDVPSQIESDYAVYFNDGGDVVGYRDLEGNFFDTQGSRTTATRVTEELAGTAQAKEGAARSEAFEDYSPQATFMPRVGVSFPVTDRALFFASYNVTSQRPTENAFAPFRTYEEVTSQNQRLSNPALEPERTTQYELGFRQRVGERAALTLSGFYRTQENKISNRRLDGGSPVYGTYRNVDFTTTKGVEMDFELRRTGNLAVNANYTLAWAQGTGSDATATGTIVWRGEFFPNFISPADFDQRHTLNASVDYRLGEGEGPEIGGARPFENFGVNLLAQYGSGFPYTALSGPGFSIGDSFTADAVGTINSARMPASTRLDLRVDRSFDLGFAGTRAKVYLTVLNLLDSENVLAVYRATGLSDYDAYLTTPGGLSYLNSQPDRDAAMFNYSAYVAGPVNNGGSQSSGGGLFYAPPRRVRLGVLLNF